MPGKKKFSPVHPGRILKEELMDPLGITAYRLAKDIRVPAPRIYEIIRGQRAITADTALRLSKYFRTSDRFWMNLQTQYDVELEKERLASDLEKISAVA